MGFLLLLVIGASCVRKAPQIPANQPDNNTEQQQMLEYNRLCIQAEQAEIAAFIARAGWQETPTAEGIYVHILNEGQGECIPTFAKVSLQYRMQLLDGTVCESSETSGIKTLVAGQRQDVTGLDLALTQLRKGSEAELLIPSPWAYGVSGNRKCVPPRCPILYHILINSVELP